MLAVLRRGFDHTEIQRAGQARRHTRGLQAHFETIHAHIALGHFAFDRVKLRCVVRAHPGAIAATEANVRILQHRAVFGELGVGARGAAFQAHRIVAVVARHRNVDATKIGVRAAFDITHRAKADVRRQIIFFAARGFAGVAAYAVVGAKVKAVLLVALGIGADRFAVIDAQAFTRECLMFFGQIDGLAPLIQLGAIRFRQCGVGRFVGAGFEGVAFAGAARATRTAAAGATATLGGDTAARRSEKSQALFIHLYIQHASAP